MPLAVRLNSQVISDLNLAVTAAHRLQPARAEEIGGLLLGQIEYPGPTRPVIHIDRFDPIESEHRRGPSYDLSERDKRVLARKLAWWNSHGEKANLRPVGFWRTHTRRGLYLDKDDSILLENFFPEPYAVVLLVRPEPGGAGVGGFFFWEDGDMHRESTYQEFPFNPSKLTLLGGAAADTAADTAAAPVPAPPVVAKKPATLPPPPPPRPMAMAVPAALPPRQSAANWSRAAIPMAALLIACAILYGLLIRKPPQPVSTARRAPVAPIVETVAKPAPIPAQPSPAVAAVTPTALPPPSALPVIEKPSPFLPKERPAAKPPAVRAQVQQPPSPLGSAARTTPPPTPALVIPSRSEAAPAAASIDPPPVLTPITAPVRIEQPRRTVRHATVTVEPVSGSRFGRAVGHIPGIGRLTRKNKDFVPARPIRQITPTVPAEEHLAHDVPVDVKVTVDPAGNVSSVDSRGGDKELARRAVDAARNWQFIPARRNDETVTSELILHFTFKGAVGEAARAQP